MSKCSQCGAETELYVNGVALCLACDQERTNAIKKGPAKEEPKDSAKTAQNSH